MAVCWPTARNRAAPDSTRPPINTATVARRAGHMFRPRGPADRGAGPFGPGRPRPGRPAAGRAVCDVAGEAVVAFEELEAVSSVLTGPPLFCGRPRRSASTAVRRTA